MSQSPRVDYAIETVIAQDGRREFRLILRARAGRGLIEEPKIVPILAGPVQCPGFVMVILGKDGLQETIGSRESPLPYELITQAQSDRGLTIMNLDDDGQIAGGQVLWMEADSHKDHLSPALKP